MISVCMASYNGEKYIKEQIDSILLQLGAHDELIISDDGSVDATLKILENYNDSRIKILHNKTRKGVIGNFENALNQAKGEYIFLCDQDDIWLPNKVPQILNHLQKYDLVVSNCLIINDKREVLCQSFFDKFNCGSGFFKNLIKNSYLGCCMAFKREIFSYILPFPAKIAMHDIWIGLSVELNGVSCFLNEPLVLYRRHADNASPTSEKSKLPISYRINYRLLMLDYLIRRKYFKYFQ